MTLDAIEFLRRFLQHVLPSGFQKVRHYGFLSPNSGTPIEAVRSADHVAQQPRSGLPPACSRPQASPTSSDPPRG